MSEPAPSSDSTDGRLAIHGGTPVIPEGPPSWPLSDHDVKVSLTQAIEDGTWGKYHGGNIEQLTESLAETHGVPFAMPTCSGTFAVELALRALKVGAGDEVILAGYDYSGNFRCIEAVGAMPVLVDIDPRTWCLDVSFVEAAIEPDKTRAILVSHLHGGVADMRGLTRIAGEHDLSIVEDACQSPGAIVQGRVAGTWGDVGVLSFGGSKLLTAGRGGAIVTSHEDVLQRAKVFCERGNETFPMSELQAAALLPQLPKLAERNARRLANVKRLLESCQDLPGLQPIALDVAENTPAFYKLAWLYQGIGDVTRDEFVAAARAEGVALDTGFRGFVRRGSRRCRRVGELTNSERAAEGTVLLHHPVLLENDATIDRVATALKKVAHGLRQS